MAVFNISFGITSQLEGGYANHPKDRGGETYAGITRKYHPSWIGWQYIDKQPHPIKTNTKFPKLEGYVITFYTKEYWNRLHCNDLEQSLANQLFDYAVNSGKGRAVKDLQSILNNLGESLKVDGAIGPNTIAAIKRHKQADLAKQLHSRRTSFLVKESKNQPVFAKTWSNRINTMKEHLPAVGISFGAIALVGIALFF